MGKHSGSQLYPALRTYTYASIASTNAVKLSVATAITQQTYSAATLDGALANPGPALTRMQELTVTSAANAATYNTTDKITATTVDSSGQTRTLTAQLTAVGGGETIVFVDSTGAAVGAHSISSIVVPAQLLATGAFTFGVRNVVFDLDNEARQIRAGSNGNVVCVYDGTITDTVPLITAERHSAFVKQITSVGTTALPVTAYL